MVQDMVKSSLTQLGVIPQETTTLGTQSQLQSSYEDLEPPQIEDISSEGQLFDSDQEDHYSGTPALNQLLITAEEQAEYDSFPSPVATAAPLWSFAEQTPSGSQTQPKTATTQANPVTSTPAKPAGPQKQAPAQAQPQAQAQAQMRLQAPAQPPRPAPAYFP